MTIQDEILDAKRYQRKLYSTNAYVTVATEADGDIHDVMTSASGERLNTDLPRQDDMRALDVMTSLALRYHEPEYVIVRLMECCGTDKSHAFALADVLIEHTGGAR